MFQLDCHIFGLQIIKKQYVNDDEFKYVMENYKKGHTRNKYVVRDGFLFRASRLWIPAGSICVLLLQEVHRHGLMGHFVAEKTEKIGQG